MPPLPTSPELAEQFIEEWRDHAEAKRDNYTRFLQFKANGNSFLIDEIAESPQDVF